MTCRLCPQPAATGDYLCADHGERAAIAEFDGGLTREVAESLIQMRSSNGRATNE